MKFTKLVDSRILTFIHLPPVIVVLSFLLRPVLFISLTSLKFFPKFSSHQQVTKAVNFSFPTDASGQNLESETAEMEESVRKWVTKMCNYQHTASKLCSDPLRPVLYDSQLSSKESWEL